jgi:hypothetical protein
MLRFGAPLVFLAGGKSLHCQEKTVKGNTCMRPALYKACWTWP